MPAYEYAASKFTKTAFAGWQNESLVVYRHFLQSAQADFVIL
jgi:hypothetical protein